MIFFFTLGSSIRQVSVFPLTVCVTFPSESGGDRRAGRVGEGNSSRRQRLHRRAPSITTAGMSRAAMKPPPWMAAENLDRMTASCSIAADPGHAAGGGPLPFVIARDGGKASGAARKVVGRRASSPGGRPQGDKERGCVGSRRSIPIYQ